MSDGLLIDLTDYRILGGTPEVTLLGTGRGQIAMVPADLIDHAVLVAHESRTLHRFETQSDTVIVPVVDKAIQVQDAPPMWDPDSQVQVQQYAIPIRHYIVGPEDGPFYHLRAGYSPQARMWFVRGAVEPVEDQHAVIHGP